MTNRLKQEASLYLQQHSDQDIHWYPYGPEALQKSKDENRPIFLSIGYASCHWCHRMSNDCFTKKDIIDYLNNNFICIKVDREEYPDIDSYYQQACQLFTNSGGWPLSAFLLPDTRPFFAGTYFPPYTIENQTGFLELCQELTRAYKDENQKVLDNATEVAQKISDGFIPSGKVEFDGHFPHPMAILEATKEFQDKEFGGHGQAPKFPNFPYLEWTVEQMLEGMIEKAEGEEVIKTIDRILFGGIYDQVRGGIHRYSVDQKWEVPHFEKMLYDQAGFLSLLAKTSLIYPAPHVYDSLIQTIEYLQAEMLSDSNYFFSSQDADSEGEEGFYFGFTSTEFIDTITKYDTQEEIFAKNLDQIKKWFPLTEQGNFGPGLNTIHLSVEHKNELLTKDGWEIIRKIKESLLEERKLRIPPATDTKGIASWNFLMSKALADVVQYCPIPTIKQMASSLLEKVLEGQFKTFLLPQDENKIFQIKHSTTRETNLPYFDDYVFFAELQLRVYEITGNEVFKENAIKTSEYITKEFLEKDKFLTRAKSFQEHAPYPNQPSSFFDTSFKSAASSFIMLNRRLSCLELDANYENELSDANEEMTHQILKNPINAGEALRALTYPDMAFRVVKVPQSWPQDGKFANFIPYFLPRFVIRYEKEDTKWQICTKESCELSGDGLDNFIQTLNPSTEENQTNG